MKFDLSSFICQQCNKPIDRLMFTQNPMDNTVKLSVQCHGDFDTAVFTNHEWHQIIRREVDCEIRHFFTKKLQNT